jgi:hypothetical protein
MTRMATLLFSRKGSSVGGFFCTATTKSGLPAATDCVAMVNPHTAIAVRTIDLCLNKFIYFTSWLCCKQVKI